MKKVRVYISLVALLWGFLISAQPDVGMALEKAPEKDKGIILGKILDVDTQIPLEFATISILSPEDSSIINGGVTDLDGKFAIELDYGTYLTKLDYISYNSIYLPVITIDKNNRKHDFGTIKMSASAELLEEIEVVAEKSELQFSLDKRIFNVGKDLSNQGGSAEDILDNIPSVTVDVEGTVSLRGSENLRILIDGKPSGLIGIGDTEGLKSLPAAMIEQVEIITNASARYEAEGSAGIINIVLKKDRSQGLNGSVDLNAGYPKNYGGALNLNMRKKAVNFFVNYGYRYREGPGSGYTYQELYNDTEIPFSEQFNTRTRGGSSHSFRTGMDLFLTERDIITGAFMYRYGNDFNRSNIDYFDYDANKNLFQITERRQLEDETEPNLEYELNYEHKYGEKGRKLTAAVQYRNNSEVEESDYMENYFDGNRFPTDVDELLQRSINDESEKNFLFQTDYIHPFGDEKKFEAGARISLRDITNNYLVEEFEDNDWMILANLSNDFAYKEDIYAAYAIYGNKISKFSYQIGLRMEHSDVVTSLVETNEINDRSYTNLFPSAHVTYELNPENSLQLSYSRRISRPRFWYLNPFFSFANNRNMRSGNPNLDPEFADSYELGYLKYWDNVTLGSSIYYRRTTGVIQRISRVDEFGITLTRPENLATSNAVGLELTTTADVTKWWRFDFSANVFNDHTRGVVEDRVLESKAFSFTNRLNTRFEVWKDAEIQVRFSYRAPRNTPQGRSKSISGFDLAFNKDILQKNGTVTVSVRDLFNMRRYRRETFDEDFYIESEWRRRPRQIRVSFNYRINQQDRKQRNRRGGGDEDAGGSMDEEGF